MIASMLKEKIQYEAKNIANSNPFFIAARYGKVTKNHINYFLNSVGYLHLHAVPYLKLAEEKSKENELIVFYQEKIQEESGHEQWALNGLNVLGKKLKKFNKDSVNKNIQLLLNYLFELINNDPKYFLIYIYYTEYLLVLYGPQLLKNLNEKCKIAPSCLTALGNHIELDVDHAEEDLRVIEKIFKTPKEWPQVEKIVDTCMRYVESFYEETLNRNFSIL